MATIRVHCPELRNEHGAPMLWLASWIVGRDGSEGAWFHSGAGAGDATAAAPPEAIGVRIRRWPHEELAPEYADIVPLPDAPIDVATLDFEQPQPFSALAARDVSS